MENNPAEEISMGESPALNLLNKIDKAFDKVTIFTRWLNVIGLAFFFLMVMFTFVDVILRYLFNRPIMGSKEITELMLVLVVSLGIAYTHSKKGHVAVDIFTGKLSSEGQLMINTVTTILSIGLFIILVWQNTVNFLWFMSTDKIHGLAVQTPAAPFAAIIVLGCVLLLLILIQDLIRNLIQSLRKNFKAYQWLIMFGTPFLIAVMAILWVQPTLLKINQPLLGFVGIICSLIFMFIGLPTSFSLMLTAFLFIGHIRGIPTALDVIGTEMYLTTSNYLWAVIAFFIIMGFFALNGRFGEDLYYSANKWFGHLSGGLAIATIGASTAFAAIVGEALSVTTTIGAVALPQMRKYRYNDRLSVGTIASGATIGPMIPPSMGFILYAILTNQSVGKLFIAGIIPGLLLAIFFITVIVVQCRINPKLGPRGEKGTTKEKLVSLKSGGPIVVLFLLVIGGVYAGIFTPTEGGAVGAVGALLIGLLMRRYTWKSFFDSLLGAGKTMGMIAIILVGANMFTRFLAWCNLSPALTKAISGLNLPPSLVVFLIVLIFFALGFVVDIMPLILIGVPIFHPVAVSIGVDPTWFTVMVVLSIQAGVITPPFAFVLFALKGMYRDIPMETIYKGVLPFVLGTLSVIILIFLIPSLATWLPNLLYQ